MHHPFDAAPYVAAAAALPVPERSLSEPDQAWIRGLRPETQALWLVSGGSALVSLLLYWAFWGLPLALGLVLGMWAHELGHLLIARRLRLALGPIVFVPLIGATQRVLQPPATAIAGAQLALAGPMCGMLFALGCKLAYLASGHAALGLLGTAHALLAILDAIPFGMLDGRRIVAALDRRQRAGCACALAALALVTRAPFLMPLIALLVWAATRPAPARGRSWIAGVYLAVIAAGCLLL